MSKLFGVAVCCAALGATGRARPATGRLGCGRDAARSARDFPACDRTSVSEEERWRYSATSSFNLELRTPGGAAATLATVSAHDDLGRGLAVGLAGWGAFGVGYTGLLVSPCSGPLCALGEPMGIGVGVLTGVLGGAVGLLATGEPGTSRRVVAITSAAVGVGMAGVGLAQDWD